MRASRTAALLGCVAWLVVGDVAAASEAGLPSLETMVRAVERVPIGDGASAAGSGFFISPNRVLTSAHVLAGCRAYVVTNRRIGSMNAELESLEPRRDSAVLSVAGVAPVHLRRETWPSTRQGAPMTIVGFPAARRGGDDPVRYAATFHRTRLDPSGIPVIQLRADIAAGASGAPVFDQERRLAGIVVGRLDDAPRDVVALSVAGLSQRTRRFFAPPDEAGSIRSSAGRDPEDAVVKIRCR